MENITLGQIGTTIGLIVALISGVEFLYIRTYKKLTDKVQEMINVGNISQTEAIKCLLRANIVNQYYVYKQLGEIPFYVKESIHKEFEAYKSLNGNSFVEDIVKEMDTWKVV